MTACWCGRDDCPAADTDPLTGHTLAPWPTPDEQREIDRFGIFAEEQGRCPDCPHVLAVHGPEGCVAASGCDCKRVAA